MGLKSLEIQGFKSFKDKITLDFHYPITAIVGPNGSGKSNISDAILWVLGEQSAKTLRGTKMQDVIFAGTDKIKPVNVCQVSMTFEKDEYFNIPYEEVTITRRVYRTGESEYYLNRAQVRLKDVREFFMDTGIGKEGYSVIGQGKIDQILSAKNDEIRSIFEEAAQISKSKFRKEESIRRLKKTNENLARVEDVLIPQRERLVFLQKEKEKAEKGRQLQERIREATFQLAHEKITRVQQQQMAIREKDKRCREEIETAQKQESIIKEKLTPCLEKLEVLKKEEEKSKRQRTQLQKAQDQIHYDTRLTEEKIQYDKKDLLRLQNEKKEQEKILESTTKQTRSLKTKKEEKQMVLQNLLKKLQKHQELISSKEKKQENLRIIRKKQKKILQELEDQIHQLSVEKMTRNRLQKSNLEKKDLLQHELNQLMDDKKVQLEYFQEVKENKHVIEMEISSLEKTNSEILNALLQRQKDLQRLSKEKVICQSKWKETVNQYRFYKNNFDNREGFFYAVQKFFKKLSSTQKKKADALADLITVQEGFEKVIEILLQPALQNIVVETKSDAKEFIGFLKREKIGRLTFLPLDSIKPRFSPPVEDPDIIGKASDFICSTERVQPLIDYFLNQTLIVKSVNVALRVSKKYPKFRIATLDGDVINTWGSMVGGYKRENTESNLLNRKKVLSELQESIRHLKTQYEELEKEYSKIEEVSQRLSEKNKNLKWTFDQQKSELEKIRQKYQKMQSDISYLEKDIQRVQKSLQNLEEIQPLVNDFDLEELTQKRENLKQAPEKLTLETISEELTKMQLEHIQLRNEADTVQRDLNLLENSSIDCEEMQQKAKVRVKSLSREIDEKSKEITCLQQSLLTFQNQWEENEKHLKALTSEIPKIEKECSDREGILQADQSKLVDLSKNIEINRYKKESYKKELQKLIQEEQEICDTIQEEFQISMNKIPKTEKKVSQKMLNDLKEDFRQIGPYSIDAIGEYHRVNENVTFLETQKEDLIKSREDVTQLIHELDREMRADFRKSFDDINHKFHEIFSILFEGGHAELVLKGDDVLDCDIEIIAKPPGKKLQSLSLLSGGERSLTAICLLFAIFETKPSSFCLLDEIDAALDELNVNRFKKYLVRFSEKTQFLIITHRKSTMEIANVLYGVSMEEYGVSKVIQCDLGE